MLDRLPVNSNGQLTPDDERVLNKYFGGTSNSNTNSESHIRWRLILYSTILYVILSIPFVDLLLSKLPYMSNAIFRMVLKIVIFAFLFFAISYFVTN